jgi:hypothetical protein
MNMAFMTDDYIAKVKAHTACPYSRDGLNCEPLGRYKADNCILYRQQEKLKAIIKRLVKARNPKPLDEEDKR